jgi:hypothetical protein
MGLWLASSELEGMTLSQNLHGGFEENHKNFSMDSLCPGRNTNRATLKTSQ